MVDILVTGATGFLGRHLCSQLSGIHRVVGVVREHERAESAATGSSANMRYHEADLAESLSLDEHIDIIIHTAARTPKSEATVDQYVCDNVVATRNIIRFALQKKVEAVVYLSAMSVYGEID
jgi:nucleoside-diphosphate-sugar epimerase